MKKADMTLSTIVKAILVLIVLGILIFILARYTGIFKGGIEQPCEPPGSCQSTCLGYQTPEGEMTVQTPSNCQNGVCCMPVSEVS